MKIKIINGPNLNMLGFREPDIYGSETLETINNEIKEFAQSLGMKVDFYQSNVEGEIVGEIQLSFFNNYDGIIINAGGYTHTSVAIRDAISSIDIPCVEVHLSNIYGREDFRANSLIAPVCKGQITGLGKSVYKLALFSFLEDNNIETKAEKKKSLPQNYCVVDVETTGFRKSDKIIQIGAVIVENGEKVNEYNQLINPGKKIPLNITKITNITNEQVANMPPISEVKEDFFDFIKGYPLVGHNLSFDINFLEREFSVILSNEKIDTLSLSRKYILGLEKYSLDYLSECLSLPKNTHNALDDCITTYKLFEYIKSVKN